MWAGCKFELGIYIFLIIVIVYKVRQNCLNLSNQYLICSGGNNALFPFLNSGVHMIM